MPTQTIQPLDPSASPITLTYEGVTESDTGPAGMVLKMVIAQAKGDTEALKSIVTEKTMEMTRSQGMESPIEVIVKDTKIEGDTATVTAELKSGPMAQELPVIVVKQQGGWRVDMHATIEKLMGGMDIAAALEEGMKQMAEGMGKVMEGVGEAMSSAFEGLSSGGESSSGGCAASDLELAPYASEFRDYTMVDWAFTGHWPSFEDAETRNGTGPAPRSQTFNALNPPLMNAVKQLLDDEPSLLRFMTRLAGIHFLWTDRPGGKKDLEIVGDLLWYTIGEDADGNPQIWPEEDLKESLRPLLESME